MAMIKCSECGTDVSDKAEKCPKCACPIAASQPKIPVQTIEQTSKGLKKHVLLSVLACIIGIIVLTSTASQGSVGGPLIGSFLLVAGIIWFIVVKVKIWWHHK